MHSPFQRIPIKPYNIPAAPVIFQEEIKKSRFITHLVHAPGIEAAKAFIDNIKTKHAGARHNCWGFVAGSPEDSVQLGFSDDGEPSGTAGKPILAQLKGSDVGEICAVVTRYSGGIKLGTGGLVKAYGGGVKQALDQLQTVEKIPASNITLHCDYATQGIIERLVGEYQGRVVESTFANDVFLHLEIPQLTAKQFIDKVFQITQGTVQGKLVNR